MRFLVILIGLAMAGCTSQPPEVPEPVAEPTFERQLLDVSSGASDVIRVKDSALDLQQLQHLGQLKNLRELRLDLTPVTDSEADVIASIDSLEIVNFPESTLTDEGIAKIATLPKLQLLRIGSPTLTDAGIAKVAESKSILYLHVLDSPITDASADSIAKMTQLESFYADGTDLTDEGMSKLVKARPKLHIHFNDLHPAGAHSGHSHEAYDEQSEHGHSH